MKKILSFVMLALILTSLLMLAFNIQPVRALTGGTIYIRADGSIDPPDAPIVTYDNVTYTLTGNITSSGDGLIVEIDNIIIDGAGFHISCSAKGSGIGIDLHGRRNVTVKHTNIKDFGTGINLVETREISVYENNLTSNLFGIYIAVSSYNRIVRNIFHECGLFFADSCPFHVVIDNVVNGKPLIYLDHVYDVIVEDAGQAVLVNCRNITVKNFEISKTSVGIELLYTEGSSIIGNTITSCAFGGIVLYGSRNNLILGNRLVDCGLFMSGLFESDFYNVVVDNYVNGKPLVYLIRVLNITIDDAGQVILVGCNNVTITNMKLSNTTVGIELLFTKNCTIEGNSIENNVVGIYSYYGSNANIIRGNNIRNNVEGVELMDSDYNSIFCNNVEANMVGIRFSYSSYNRISRNNFIDNVQQVSIHSKGSANVWDFGYPFGGNYWSDYTGVDYYSGPDQDQPGSDGIGDTPYIIDEANIDHYPLMSPWTPAPSYKFLIGEVVWATADLYVREGPGLGYAILDTMVKGNRGVVLEGPVEADGYNWWKINYSVGVVGWSAENWLEEMPSPPQPPYGFAYWAEAAVSWAMQSLGRGDWSELCMQFVANAYMQEEHKEVECNAIDGAREFYRFNQEPNGWLQAPKGALIFFDMEGTNELGHVGIYLGNGSILHAYGTVTVNTVEEAIAKPDVGRYLGWSYPPETWRPTKFMFNATYDGVNYPVTIFTNSTIMNFAFHQPLKQISFLVYGEPGAMGYCNITILKALLQGEPWTVKLNGTSCSFTLTENQTHSFIYIAYTFNSAYEITIEGTWVIPEFHDFTIIQPLMLITFTLIILSKRKTKKPPNLPINPAKQNNLNHALKTLLTESQTDFVRCC